MEKQKKNQAADKVKELLDKLEAGVKDVFESEQYKAYLKAMAKFHSYSFGNVMLILLQCPNASLVAGFHKWKKDFGRTVKKGEHGIQILAPCPHKRFVEQEVEKPDGTKEKESVLIVQQGFKVAYVFDVSQTEGRELPSFGVDKLTGDVQHYDEFYKALKDGKVDGVCTDSSLLYQWVAQNEGYYLSVTFGTRSQTRLVAPAVAKGNVTLKEAVDMEVKRMLEANEFAAIQEIVSKVYMLSLDEFFELANELNLDVKPKDGTYQSDDGRMTMTVKDDGNTEIFYHKFAELTIEENRKSTDELMKKSRTAE